MTNNKYKTLTAPTTGDFRDRGSKFLAYAYPVSSLQEIKDKLRLLKKEHPKAVHHCYAWRLGTDGSQHRANDDGEPSGSAGKPILGQIDSFRLTNVLIVVVRYFGGTLLGIPGLINAYKTVTSQALTDAAVTEKWIERSVEIALDHPAMGEVMHLLRRYEAIIYNQDVGLFCTLTTGIPVSFFDECLTRLSEIRSVKVTVVDT